MSTAFQMKRLQFEEQNLEENNDQLASNCAYKNFTQYSYIVQYVGENGTPHDGAYIVVDVDLSGSNGHLTTLLEMGSNMKVMMKRSEIQAKRLSQQQFKVP